MSSVRPRPDTVRDETPAASPQARPPVEIHAYRSSDPSMTLCGKKLLVALPNALDDSSIERIHCAVCRARGRQHIRRNAA